MALVQFAVLYRNGQKTSMSTRSGEFVTLRQLFERRGLDPNTYMPDVLIQAVPPQN